MRGVCAHKTTERQYFLKLSHRATPTCSDCVKLKALFCPGSIEGLKALFIVWLLDLVISHDP